MNYSDLLIEQLIAQGVHTFCVAPGSRSSPLALAIARCAKRSIVHFDERSLGFYALGLAKATRRATALLVTSGTAVANLLAAVMEASNDHIPLILLTADRPAELRDCSANQTIDQVKLFANFVRYQADLPLCDPAFSTSYLASIISHAYFCAQAPRPGPVHLNCMLREPVVLSVHTENVRNVASGELTASHATIQEWTERLQVVKKGWILLGSVPHDTQIEPYLNLARILNWPIYADVLSQCRTRREPHFITHMDLIIKTGVEEAPEVILHFGGRTLSKTILLFLKKHAPALYLHVSECPTLLDPYSLVTHRLYATDHSFATRLSQTLAPSLDSEWLCFWQNANKTIASDLDKFFCEHSALSEPSLIREVSAVAAGKAALFLANSMPIRDADAFLPRLESPLSLFGNRGVSGIDGNIATAAGIAHGLNKPLIALIGDLAFLHDMNSLALLKNIPLCLLVINNQGGGIFSFLDVAREKEEIFEKFLAATHTLHFSHAAALFDISYIQPSNQNALKDALQEFIEKPRALLIEVCTNRKENVELHTKITQSLKEALYVPA
jgi:2-succinyl-5-enolpyruvyl-6-hydroxy-3-cyclohexene-1-carboxylate synthase